MKCWQRFWVDDGGQDLLEYALLTALIGLVGLAVWGQIVSLIGARYDDYDNVATGVPSLWESPAP